ncbi:MAG TPA: HAD-IA family hydrolase [Polyangia bacterium]|jgi:HAD superfamily hydrolase (TIGR01509 family)|nr:HAD-IA family hydrolase [Polyangia bacterium]
MKRGFIFDLDGTLADTMPVHYAAWTKIAARYGLSFPETRFYELGGVPTRRISQMLIADAGLTLDPEMVAREKEQAFSDSLQEPGIIRPIDAVVVIARQRHAEGPLAIASGGSRRLVQRTLELIGLADWFAAVVTAEDTVRHKPEPDVFLEAARRIDVPATACTVYEDTDLGLEAARRAGMAAVDIRKLL